MLEIDLFNFDFTQRKKKSMFADTEHQLDYEKSTRLQTFP